tara:strand:+ start:1067 stop:1654 length:588 start_codon:yes stop_codon:yes gene_type:complete
MNNNASNTAPMSLTKMNKKQLYDEVRDSRITIQKYKETENQVKTSQSLLQERTDYIQELQSNLEITNKKLNNFYQCFDKKTLDQMALEKGDVLKHNDYLKYLTLHNNQIVLLKNNNIKLEGELVDVLNHPCSSCAIQSMVSPNEDIKTKIFDDIFKLYKDKINRFEEVEIENKKYKKILKGIYDSMDGHALLFTE